jgi:superfamily II DNA or RNA helicase
MDREHQEELLTLDLFTSPSESRDASLDLQWPHVSRFPLNTGSANVKKVVLGDLKRSSDSLLVTGYASLDQIIDFSCDACTQSEHQVRLLIGNEPFLSRRDTYSVKRNGLTHEMEAYWLQRGISLIYSAKIIQMIELLKAERIQARYLEGGKRLHAKIYCGDEAATVGSSNFTNSGMQYQHEANVRFDAQKEPKRFKELTHIAENFWNLGSSYQDELTALLEKLLQVVTWQEALARACAELLEGEWAETYLREGYLAGAGELWPSQKQGIAQALYVLSNQGSVLIADATGAGKTRMGIYLIGAVQDDILRKGRIRQGKTLMICPPTVEEDWIRESTVSGVPLETYSHGKLSSKRARRHELTVEALRRAQLLCVDEGHNFLNFRSQRTQQLLRNMADHVVLLTATPLNRSVLDLLRIADMLGADNLSPSVVKAFQKMLGKPNINRTLTEEETNELKTEINKFTVRRTKNELNRLVDREPERYLDRDGRQCRFPKHKAQVYGFNESDKDRAIAQEIRSLASKLHGVTHFVKPIEMPDVLARQGVSEESYLKGRLAAATKLSRYLVMSSLRSSRIALMEHIRGTENAKKLLDLKHFSKSHGSGNMRRQLMTIVGDLPENRLSIELPDWLADEKAHEIACREDLKIYQKIADLTMEMSDGRERRKAELLRDLLKQHDLVLAFDSRPISLAMIQQLIKEKQDVKTLMAWGSASSEKSKILTAFAHGSEEKGLIGLCSDSLSEGVNLQQASSLVHLDMPSVVRVAEQRAGRVDRMDSPHEEIEIWWPDDAEEFALSSDERFIERYETVEKLLGSNMPLPETMKQQARAPVNVQTMIRESEEADQKPWDGIDDAFQPVRNLIAGRNALIHETTYEHYRNVHHRVLSRVSLVSADSPWAFFCMSAGTFKAPKWVIFTSVDAKPKTELSSVTTALRARLDDDVEDLELTQKSGITLDRFLARLSSVERHLLSQKKQRALDEATFISEKLITHYSAEQRQREVEHLGALIKMLKNPPPDKQPDWDEVASRWLDLIRPVWFEKLSGKRKKPLLLKDIRNDLLSQPDWLMEQLETHFREFPMLPKPEERVRACIIGVSQ